MGLKKQNKSKVEERKDERFKEWSGKEKEPKKR